jgi:membrane protein YqaA with SNARE-associated domain
MLACLTASISQLSTKRLRGYPGIALMMALESRLVPIPSEIVVMPSAGTCLVRALLNPLRRAPFLSVG